MNVLGLRQRLLGSGEDGYGQFPRFHRRAPRCCIVHHSKDLQPMKLQQGIYGEQAMWVRPADMFAKLAKFNSQLQPRLTRDYDSKLIQNSTIHD
jgi:hypothetical protein